MLTVPRTLTVEVGTPAVLSWLDLPASVTEGEEAEFGCQAVGGYPPPRLEVTGLANLRSGSLETTGGGAGGLTTNNEILSIYILLTYKPD